jgi:transposase
VADAPEGPTAVGHGALLVLVFPAGGAVGEDQRRLAGTGAGAGETSRHPERRHYRQPERQNDGKRGAHGYDAGKKVNGRKRHIVVDTLGLLLTVLVHSADIQDCHAAPAVLWRLRGRFPRLRLIWADASYAGVVGWTRRVCHWALAIVRRREGAKGFEVLPRRWVVERTLAWLGRYRRLSKDYEQLPQSSESMILLAMINLMSCRLAKTG